MIRNCNNGPTGEWCEVVVNTSVWEKDELEAEIF